MASNALGMHYYPLVGGIYAGNGVRGPHPDSGDFLPALHFKGVDGLMWTYRADKGPKGEPAYFVDKSCEGYRAALAEDFAEREAAKRAAQIERGAR